MHHKGALFTITFYDANISIFFYTATFFCFFMISPATFPPLQPLFNLIICPIVVRYLYDTCPMIYRTSIVQITYK